jgi:hypothetical protein
MNGTALTLFLLASFVGGVTSGVAGFALGLVVSGVWLHIITPVQTATLIVFYALATQSVAIWKLRHALNWRGIAPFIIGGAVGIPLGTMLLTYVDPSVMRVSIGVLIMVYAAYGLARPEFMAIKAGTMADVAVGVLNGLLGGLTGLVGIIITVWCQWRGWSKDAQRTVFQPVMLVSAVMTAVSLGVAGAITVETAKLYVLGLPALLAGLWCGFWLYGRLDDVAFRKMILWLLLVSGMSLIVPASLFGLVASR